jgi:hypothetical protein
MGITTRQRRLGLNARKDLGASAICNACKIRKDRRSRASSFNSSRSCDARISRGMSKYEVEVSFEI